MLSATNPLGTVTAFTYDSFGNLIKTVADYGTDCLTMPSTNLCQTMQMAYDSIGDATSLTDPNGNVTSGIYDADRRMTSVTLPAAASGALVTTTSYDADGRVIGTAQSANGTALRSSAAAYSLTGKVVSATDYNGNATTYIYDGDDRLSSVTDPLRRVTDYGYDSLSRLHTVSNPAIQSNPLVTRTYSLNGDLATLAIARSNSVADATDFAYDGLDRLSTTTWTDSSTETLSYDADSNVTKRVTRKGDSISFAYDTLNRPCTKTYAATAVTCGGTSGNYLVSYRYDLAGHLIAASDNAASIMALAGSANYGETMTYGARNNQTHANWSPAPAQTLPMGTSAAFTYQYDATNRRVGQTATDKSWWNYPTTARSISYTTNDLNQYTAVGSAAPTYDGDGNLTNDGTYSYCYDAESHLTKILSSGTCASPTTVVASYGYDAQGRRKSKTVGSTTTIYVTDADNREVVEYDGTSGAVGNWYAYGLGPNAALNQMNGAGNDRETLIPDVQGSIVASLDASAGARSASTGYQPFGENPGLSSGSFQYTAARFGSGE